MMITREFLEQEYKVKRRSSYNIAKELGCSFATILLYLKKYGIERRKTGTISQDLTGREFGTYKVLRFSHHDKSGPKWHCICKICNKDKPILQRSLTSNRTKRCVSCTKGSNWKGFGEISGGYLRSLKIKAKHRRMIFSVTGGFLWKLFQKQGRCCCLSGVPLSFVSSYSKRSKIQTASLDRIDSNKGYSQDNVQWVHKAVNFMKKSMSVSEFREWCQRIVNNSIRAS